MLEYLQFFLILLIPAYLVCGLLYLWSRHCRVPPLARILRLSAIGWAIALTLTFHFATLSAIACDGNGIFGFHNCSVIPAQLADTSLAVVIFSFGAGAIYGAAVVALGGIIELVAARRRAFNTDKSAP